MTATDYFKRTYEIDLNNRNILYINHKKISVHHTDDYYINKNYLLTVAMYRRDNSIKWYCVNLKLSIKFVIFKFIDLYD